MKWRNAALCVAFGLLAGTGFVTAGEEKAAAKEPPPLTAEQLRDAVAGFKGFLAGDVVARNDTGIVLLVRSVTIVEGSQAKNPGILLSRNAQVRYATEKDGKGNDRPMKSLVSLMQRLEQLPPMLFGGGLGGNVVIAMGEQGGGAAAGGAAGPAHVQMQRMIFKAGPMHLEMDENGVRLLKGDGEVEVRKGPPATVRVLAQEDGSLVMDRALPGMQPAATWDGLPQVEFGDLGGAEEPPKLPEPPGAERGRAPKDAQF